MNWKLAFQKQRYKSENQVMCDESKNRVHASIPFLTQEAVYGYSQLRSSYPRKGKSNGSCCQLMVLIVNFLVIDHSDLL